HLDHHEYFHYDIDDHHHQHIHHEHHLDDLEQPLHPDPTHFHAGIDEHEQLDLVLDVDLQLLDDELDEHEYVDDGIYEHLDQQLHHEHQLDDLEQQLHDEHEHVDDGIDEHEQLDLVLDVDLQLLDDELDEHEYVDDGINEHLDQHLHHDHQLDDLDHQLHDDD